MVAINETIRNKASSVLGELNTSSKKVILVCTSDFPNFYDLWEKVIDLLKQDKNIRIHERIFTGWITNCSNSDGDGAWDEPYSVKKYFLTKAII